MDAKQLLQDALELPSEARAALAGQLLASLDDAEPDPDRDAAWANEIGERLAAYDRGETATVPAAELIRQLRAVTDDENL